MEIASRSPDIDYFCYVKGGCMVLETSPSEYSEDPLALVSYNTYYTDAGSRETGHARVFHRGDVVFFSNKDGKEWLGSAPGLCDTYFKK